MADFPDLFLLRHGQTMWNREGRMQGQGNSDLTPLGHRQAISQGAILATLDVPKTVGLYCSPLGRARQTADHALEGFSQQVQYDDRLKEIGLGQWEGRLRAEVVAQTPKLATGQFTELEQYSMSPGGETYEVLQARVVAFLDALSGPAVIVAHGITLTVLRGVVLGLSFDQITRLERPQGCVIRICDGVDTLYHPT